MRKIKGIVFAKIDFLVVSRSAHTVLGLCREARIEPGSSVIFIYFSNS